MNVWYKMGVKGKLIPPAQEGFRKLCWLWNERGYGDMYVTSIREGTHLAWSFHYAGRAFDVRYPTTGGNTDTLEEEFRQLAGWDWDVVFEADHIHFELEKLP